LGSKLVSVALCATLLASLSLSACTAVVGRPPGSGFLGDTRTYRAMVPSEITPNTWVWRDPGRSLREFAAIHFEPTVIMPAPAGGLEKLDPERVEALARAFDEELVAAVSPEYRLAAKPEEGVLWVRPAITIVDPALTFFGVDRPLGKPGKGAGGAAVEMDFRDGMTQRRIAALQARGFAEWTEDRAGEASWDRPRDVLRRWAETLRKRLDEAHGRLPPPDADTDANATR
jgi:hypothetical protein